MVIMRLLDWAPVYMIPASQVVPPNGETWHAGMMYSYGPKIPAAEIDFVFA